MDGNNYGQNDYRTCGTPCAKFETPYHLRVHVKEESGIFYFGSTPIRVDMFQDRYYSNPDSGVMVGTRKVAQVRTREDLGDRKEGLETFMASLGLMNLEFA